jgi:general L-amino acid transport system permease protein
MSVSSPPVAIKRSRTPRSIVVQLTTIAVVIAASWWLFANVQANLASRSIASGFGFLRDAAGFAIGETSFAYNPSNSFARAILVGLINTLKVSALAIVGATVLGTALGLARLSPNVLLRGVARLYIELVRNIPLLLQLLLLYAALLMMLPPMPHAWDAVSGLLVSNRGIAVPAVSGFGALVTALAAFGASIYFGRRARSLVRLAVASAAAATTLFALSPELTMSIPTLGRFNLVGGWQLSTEMLTLVAGLSLYSAAYIAEIVRGGVLSVPVGQREAAASLGLTRFQTLRWVVLPQSMRAILPPLGSWYLNTVKNSSLAVAIAYPDLVSIVDTMISQTGQAIEGVAIIVLAYLTINLAIAGLINAYNARLIRIGAAAGVTGAVHAPTRRQSGHLSLRERISAELFPNASQSSLSLGLLIVAALACWHIIDWLVFSAAYHGGSSACRAAEGACWPFLAENSRLILFGMYPPEQQWRTLAVMAVFAVLLAISFVRAFWNARLGVAWVLGLLVILFLMGGGVFGLPQVSSDKWSGLPLTAVLASIALLGALPIAILLALARRSTALVPRMLASGFIEFVRGTPLIGVLFMAAVMFPLLLPTSFEVNSLMRVQIALVLFTAAYMAESIRAGLQAVPNGQLEAATSLGLSHSQALRHVILPQALRTSLPSLVNTSISEVKNTTLVLIVGMFDLLQTTRLSLVDIEWRPYFVEAYGFTATVFFVICFVISQLSRRIERHLSSASVGGAGSKEIA